MKYRLIAFDFDGTLADSFPFFLEIFGTLADTHGFARIDHADIDKLRGHDAKTLMRHVGLPLWKFPLVAADFKRLMAANITRIKLFEGVAEVLQQLVAAGIELAVVSSNSADNVRSVLGAEAALITHFECGVDLFGKRDKLRQLLRRSALSPHEMLSIGDELRDLEAARACNIPCGAVSWGYSRFDVLLAQSPDEAFRTVGELATRLR
ncbi:MAG TPA: HAD-IA family hydrolase [Rhodocyclaceae bacterium]|nr:HAD-IA family hydrolase [Rhodocyclaceae bacterium]